MKVPKSWKKVTPVSKTVAIILFIALPFFGVWFGMQYQKAIDSYNYFLNVKPAATTPLGTDNTINLTMVDNGRIIYMHVGDTVNFNLGSTYRWGVSLSDPSLLQQTAGVNGQYKAVKAGTEIIKATGAVDCKPGRLCPLFAIYFVTSLIIK